MKKKIISVLFVLFSLSGCFAKSAVVYFSCTGNSKQIAQTAAKSLNCDIFEIIPEVPYTAEDRNWKNEKSRTTFECNNPSARPKISRVISTSATESGTANFDSTKYETIILVYPIWWGNAPKILYTFMENNDFNRKNLIIMCTSGSSGLGNSGKKLSEHAKGAIYKGGKNFKSYSSETEIKEFIIGSLK